MPPSPNRPESAKDAPPEEPKRFIRTLESDAAALQEGSRPGFTQVDGQGGGASQRIVEGSVLPPPLPPPKSAPYAPPPPPTPASRVEAPLHTYTSDFSERLKEEKASTATVLAAEGDIGLRRPRRSFALNVPLIAGGILLIILGAGGAYATYRSVSLPQPVTMVPVIAAPIFVNEREEVSGGGTTLAGALVISLQNPPGAGSIRLLYTLVATSTGNDVFHALQFPAPGSLLRNISAEGSMAGIVALEGGASPFFILKVSSYGDTFAGMLAWEPRMSADLAILFPPQGTTTPAFVDEVIANHDARALRSPGGRSVVVYGYWDPTLLIIARDENAYTEILRRLSTSRTVH
ncbi:hypothetical protein A3H77_01075 [Candidatus Kaiserbacteria bacterium RIFCSPLOWO2_02_FULL_56_11]|uniref:Uncharacterized protein n=2 Tax=Candidatus Kaiseribacteriota TaxID=1752734 RepID=A0A1F6E4R3_9BACT|nr:MAG: hypothetical protein A3C95_00740 [Candidatus Kaiserbacteria bacterium RIFCSPHIGHO2_02_FULL_56_30]OGG72379.1 MAG: hypothetical protein A3E65_01620 [Candidatus Kaiserbacteria bacterium RIFCSPHIGHO2_12_FULL_56_13]OGG82173.1 MAG: hypothetical protein A3H77_01075 [Candidatus Kaiserbacteria bacterium RIFCSPLOWO2_02_FULL_56_11]